MGYFGIKLVLLLLAETNAVTCTFVTSTRKALTVLFSFIVFPKPFTLKYFVGALLVFFSLFLHLFFEKLSKTHKNENKEEMPQVLK